MFDPNIGLDSAPTQNADAEKAKMMADMLRKQTSAGTQGKMVGKIFVPPSPIQQLMPLLTGFAK